MNLTSALNYINLPLNHISKKSSSRSLSMFLNIFNYWFKYEDKEIMDQLAEIITTIKDTTIMQDDIQDQSINRRGLPCSYRVYGIGQTFNTIIYHQLKSLSKIIEIIDSDKMTETLNSVIEGISNTALGQSVEAYYEDNLIVPTIEEVKEMMVLKASSTFKYTCNIPKILSGSDLNLDRVCILLGLYTQMINDLECLTNTDYSDTKSFAEDITEGKFSIPIVHAINANPGDTTIINILKMRTQDGDIKKMAIDYLEQSGSFDYAKKVIEEVKSELIEELKKFEKNPYMESLLNNNMNY